MPRIKPPSEQIKPVSTQHSERPSQAMVAQRAGVSTATVSLALNSHPRIPAATRQRVLAVAQEIGYQQDMAMHPRRATSQRVNRTPGTRVLAFLWNSDQGCMMESSFHRTLFAGASDAACRLSQNLLLIQSRTENLAEAAAACGADGYVLASPDTATLDAARRTGRPMVAFTASEVSCTRICFDQTLAVQMAFQSLYAQGHRKIGFLGLESGSSRAYLLKTAYLNCLHAAGIPVDERLIGRFPDSLHRDRGMRAMRQLWVNQRGRPTAVLACDDHAALGAIRALGELGIDVPRTVSVIGIDGLPEGEHSTPRLTTVATGITGMGARAVEVLEEAVRTRHCEPQSIIMPIALQWRQSVAMPPRELQHAVTEDFAATPSI
ncbi:MAG: LacI family DNA-binding transcriptional regulator [Candidatus Methylacidiphilales bacterium]|nr:LacI family DNA-binding transcriptional regulator [Candidatus Methylacidiphilales bacterium]